MLTVYTAWIGESYESIDSNSVVMSKS